MLHNFRRSKLIENWNFSKIFEVETKYKVHLTQKLTGLKFKMASLSVKFDSHVNFFLIVVSFLVVLASCLLIWKEGLLANRYWLLRK